LETAPFGFRFRLGESGLLIGSRLLIAVHILFRGTAGTGAGGALGVDDGVGTCSTDFDPFSTVKDKAIGSSVVEDTFGFPS